jgi:hypothetical protein
MADSAPALPPEAVAELQELGIVTSH